MSFKKIIMSSVVAAAVTTTAFAALGNDTQKGNYLAYPAYYADAAAGWETNIRVVNTNTTHAVVAKVVIREYATSKELLDFPIYLSPGDVWTADLTEKTDGVYISSTDDSNPTSSDLDQILNNNNTKVGTSYGYVEIQAIADIEAIDINSTWERYDALDKQQIRDYFAASDDNLTIKNNLIDPIDNLFGQQLASNTVSGTEKSMTLPATALTLNTDIHGVLASSGWNSPIKGTLSGLFATDTRLNTVAGTTTADNEVRAALETQAVHVINYTDAAFETQLILTQLQKHTNSDASTPYTAPYYELKDTDLDEKIIIDATGSTSTFFYQAQVWDNEETTENPADSEFSGTSIENGYCATEVCYISTSTLYKDYPTGWVNFTLGAAKQRTTDDRLITDTVPTISTVLTGTRVNGVGVVNMLPAAITK